MDELKAKARPLFLSILCVLTFIGSTYQLSGSFGSYRHAEETAANPAEIMKAIEDMEELELPTELQHLPEAIGDSAMENNKAERIRNNAVGMIISALFTLFGAFAMWRMKRLGYFAYIVGILIYVITPWMTFDGIMADLQGYLALGIGGFFSLLYTINLKHLN